jgi:hypothetical protein
MAPTIFAPGRMTLQKGMDMLVEAAPTVLASFRKHGSSFPAKVPKKTLWRIELMKSAQPERSLSSDTSRAGNTLI